MFFDLILLRRQHKGRFGFAWIAATRGIQHISKKDVLDLDIGQLCDEISQYAGSESDSPRSRFSLRLSVLLTNGTIKIYKQKATYVIEDFVKFMTSISRPAGVTILPKLEHTEIFATPPSPVLRRKGKKRRPSIEKSTPQSQLEKLVADITAKEIEPIEFQIDQAVLQARAEEITLRESQLQREAPVEEFGALGVLPLEEELIRKLAEPDKETAPTVTSLQPIEEVPEPIIEGITPLEKTPRKKRIRRDSSSSSEGQQAPVTLIVEAQIHVSADVEMVTPPDIRRRKSERRAAMKEIPAVERVEEVEKVMEVEVAPEPRPVLEEMEVEAVEKRDKKMLVRKKKKDEDLAKLLISVQPTRVVRINRCDADEVDWIDIDPCPLPSSKLKIPNLTNLLNLYLIREDRDLERRRKTEPSSLEHSLSLRRKSGVVTPPVEIPREARVAPSILAELIEEPVPEIRVSTVPEVPIEEPAPGPEITESHLEVARPLVTSTPRRTLETETIEEVMAVAAEERLESPRKRRKLIDVEPEPAVKDLDFITLPTELESRELTVSGVATIQQETVDSVPLPILTERGRQQDIVNKIFISGRMTLEEVCQRPINKLNIARSFNDVLVLCRYNYVTLVSEDDSSALKFIQRGPKMNR